MDLQEQISHKSIKNIQLIGFDSTQPHKLKHIWNDAYNATGHNYFRFIIDIWNGTTWVTVFDSTPLEMPSIGLVNNKVGVYDDTIGGKRVIVEIDFSLIPINRASALNAGEPELVFAKNVFKIEDETLQFPNIDVFNANKVRFESRRKPTFAFIWDDLNISDALVYSIFREYGFLPNFALRTSRLTTINAIEYQEYYMNGCSILAHSENHPVMYNADGVDISYTNVDSEMKNSKTSIESYGMKVSGWVTPYSSLHNDFYPLMEKNFGYGFTGLNSGVYNQTINPLKLHRYGLEANSIDQDLTAIKTRIDTAIVNSELLVFYGHNMPSTVLNTDSSPSVTEADLREILDYLKIKSDDNLCQVLSCDEAIYNYYKAPFI